MTFVFAETKIPHYFTNKTKTNKEKYKVKVFLSHGYTVYYMFVWIYFKVVFVQEIILAPGVFSPKNTLVNNKINCIQLGKHFNQCVGVDFYCIRSSEWVLNTSHLCSQLDYFHKVNLKLYTFCNKTYKWYLISSIPLNNVLLQTFVLISALL